MVPLLTLAASGVGAVLSSAPRCSLKFVHPVPPLFSKRRTTLSASRLLKPLTLANATESSGGTKPTPSSSSSSSVPFEGQGSNPNPNPISFVGQENVPLEGVIQFEKPDSASLIAKWGSVASVYSVAAWAGPHHRRDSGRSRRLWVVEVRKPSS